jgi:hypothetical protein
MTKRAVVCKRSADALSACKTLVVTSFKSSCDRTISLLPRLSNRMAYLWLLCIRFHLYYLDRDDCDCGVEE